jgi:hypothetical protein
VQSIDRLADPVLVAGSQAAVRVKSRRCRSVAEGPLHRLDRREIGSYIPADDEPRRGKRRGRQLAYSSPAIGSRGGKFRTLKRAEREFIQLEADDASSS